jgi:hypothetical protein
MDRPARQRPKLFIVNLQWTPKDSAAKVKINGKCDDVMRNVMAILERKVPDYHQPNDPLFTYSTPLNPLEKHTSTRTNLVVKKTEDEEDEEMAKEAVSKDHPYASPERTSKRPRRSPAAMRGRLVDGAEVEYKSVVWPRDALYLPYQPFFEYIDEDNENVGTDVFCCDCCDPSKKPKKRSRRQSQSESSSEDEEDEEEEENGKVKQEEVEDGVQKEIKEEVDVKMENIKTEEEDDHSGATPNVSNGATPDVSDGESSVAATAKNNMPVNQPGWFGKGRKRRTR